MANQMRIKVENEHVLVEPMIAGLDTSNVLASYSSSSSEYTSKTWTITQDGFVRWNPGGGTNWFNMDDVQVAANVSSGDARIIPALSGTVITLYGYGPWGLGSFTLYGRKYNGQ